MNVLIVEDEGPLARLWADHVERSGGTVTVANTQLEAEDYLRVRDFAVVVLNLRLSAGDAAALADYASFRRPEAKVVFVTSNSFFSDGSIFGYMPNACAMVPDTTPPDDLAALVEYHGRETEPA